MFYKPGQVVTVHIEANIEWAFARDSDSGEWIGVCTALNLNAMGDTFADVQTCASEAVHLLLLDLFREGELEAFLRENGWKPHVPLPERSSSPQFDAPYQSRLARLRDLVPSNA